MPIESFLRYDKHKIPVVLPDHARILRAKHVEPLPNPTGTVAKGLKHPIGSLPLSEALRRRKPQNVVITISDITRPVPNRQILVPILRTLHSHGIGKEKITIIVATGMHRPSTADEKIELVGRYIAETYQIIDHRSEVQEQLVPLPKLTKFGTQAHINRLYMQADFKIVTGFIEPHFMAGFSGGRKGVCPGLANVETVQKFHGFRFLDSPKATNFMLAGNPLHEEATEVAEMAGIDFLVNVGLNEDKKMSAVFAGDWREAFFEGARLVRKWTAAPVEEPFDVVVTCCGGYPLDKTLYQAGKGMCAALPIVKQGGVVICVAACSEGLGSSSFSQIMREWGDDWQAFIEHLRSRDTTIHDQWGFQMHTKVLRKVGVEGLRFLSGGIPFHQQSQMSLSPIMFDITGGMEALRKALQREIDRYANRSIAIIPDGPYTVPVLE